MSESKIPTSNPPHKESRNSWLGIIAFVVVLAAVLYISFQLSPSNPTATEVSQPKLPGVTIHGKPTENIGWLEVVEVVDGDQVDVSTDDQQKFKIRLESIDAPELNQPYGEEAKQALNRLVFGRKVDVLKTGEDENGNTLAFLRFPGNDVNKKMILDGHAWHNIEYSDDAELAAAEIKARDAKRGLWAADDPVAPWEWRQR